jgi:hypothetical protein
MQHFEMTETQVQQSVTGSHMETAVSIAIREAIRMSGRGGVNFTVVSTKHFGICIYSDFQMKVREDEINEIIYCTDTGFIFEAAA